MVRIFHDWRDIPPSARGGAVALGNFDGVHLGHRHLLNLAHAARPDLPRAVFTFDPHPREIFRPDDPPFRLTLSETRARLLEEAGVSIIYEIPFSRALSDMPAETFITEALHRGIGAALLACGPDFAFGHRRGGNTALLAREAEALGIGLTLAPPLTDAHGPLSSSRIRRDLQDGYPERARAALGRLWAVHGPVTHGEKRGRTIGFPTANVPLGNQIEPARGVYAVLVTLADGARHKGVANIGLRPTVNAGTESRVEAHIFDYAGDLYGQAIDVGLHTYLRPEKKFASFGELTAQIVMDAAEAREILANP